jgi:hypothetical protein
MFKRTSLCQQTSGSSIGIGSLSIRQQKDEKRIQKH